MKKLLKLRLLQPTALLFLVSALWSIQALAQPSITVGSGSGEPGDSILIPIDFVNDGSVVAFNFDILFDAADIPSVDVLVDCDGNEFSSGTVVCTTPDAGVVRIIVYTFPTLDEIVSGTIATLEFFTDINALGSYSLVIDTDPGFLSFSDNSGLAVTPDVLVDGEIIITQDLGLLDVQPPVIIFPTVPQGSATLSDLVTIVNDDSAPIDLTVDDIVLIGDPGFEFGTGGDCPLPPFVLEAGAFCELEVVFDPVDAGAQAALLVVESADADIINDRTELFAEVIGDDAELILDPPTAMNFGTLVAGAQSACQTLIAENVGIFGSLGITNITLGGSPFSLQNNTCIDALLEPEEFCSIDVCFIPTVNQVGTFNDTLTLFSDANDASILLTGTGQAPPSNALLQVTPTLLNFGMVNVDEPGICQTVVASNQGTNGALEGLGVTIVGGAPFSIGADVCSGTTLPPGGACTFSVCFAATAAGAFSDQVIVSSSVNSSSVAVQGQAQVPRPPGELSINPTAFDFGTRLVGTSPVFTTFELTNSGPDDALEVVLSSLAINGDDGFTILGGSCSPGSVLSQGEPGCSVMVAFAPDDGGSLSATLAASAQGGQAVEAGLSGEGQVIEAEPLDDLIVFRGERGLDSVGAALDFVGGFNNPDRTELLLGAPDGLGENPGAAWVISDILLGLGAFLDEPPLLSDIAAADGQSGVRILPEDAPINDCHFGNQGFGYGVAGLRDRGGEDDQPLVAISAPGFAATPGSDDFDAHGAVYLLSGSPPPGLGTVSVAAWLADDENQERLGTRIVNRSSTGVCIGAGVRALGDIDGSGDSALSFQELPISLQDSASSQTTYVVHQPGLLIGGPDLDLSQDHDSLSRIQVPFNEGRYFPLMTSVAGLGDFNGNGFADIALTAPNARFYSVATDSWHAGAAFVLFGREGGLPAQISIPTEIDADTLGDEVLVIFGPEIADADSSGIIGIDLFRFGASVDGAGDFNGNGFADLVIGIGDTETVSGSAAIIFGGDHQGPLFVNDLGSDRLLALRTSNLGDTGFGESVRGVGDISGNGLDDVLIAAPWADLTGSDGASAVGGGRVYQVHGRAQHDAESEPDNALLDLATAPGDRVQVLSLESNLPGLALANSRFGLVMAGAGEDLTGNQVPDLAISAVRGLAANGQGSGGWAVILPGQAEPSILQLDAQARPPLALIPGRPLLLRVENGGEARLNELVLSIFLEDSSLPIAAALTQLQSCTFDGGGFSCQSASDPAWQCATGAGSAICTLPTLSRDSTTELLLVVGEGARTEISIGLEAANAASVELTTTVE